VARATKEAQQRGLNVKFRVADMTNLREVSEAGFDVVSLFDDALPHLTFDELIHAAGAMATKLKQGGPFIASIRNYDSLLQEKPAMQPPLFFGNTKTEESSIRSGTGPKTKRTLCTFTSQWKPSKVGIHTISSQSTGR
jgi:hypothetical protein